jgi:ATP-dependent NAD(P)H-hydrate dehydratase
MGYHNAVITPNAVEFLRLCKDSACDDAVSLSSLLGGVTVLQKSSTDVIAGAECAESTGPGSLKRFGGQGDILAGSLGVFLAWAHAARLGSVDRVAACWAASQVTRRAAARAFAQHQRATTTSDAIAQLGAAVQDLWPRQGPQEALEL